MQHCYYIFELGCLQSSKVHLKGSTTLQVYGDCRNIHAAQSHGFVQ